MTRDLTIQEIMDATTMAYARPGYGERRWEQNIIDLKMAGFTGIQIQGILRSKYARWADDAEISILEYLHEQNDKGSRRMENLPRRCGSYGPIIGSKEDAEQLAYDTDESGRSVPLHGLMTAEMYDRGERPTMMGCFDDSFVPTEEGIYA